MREKIKIESKDRGKMRVKKKNEKGIKRLEKKTKTYNKEYKK